jgi:hypothetical protein
MRLILALTGMLLWACKGDPVKCNEGCRNFASLVFWKNAEARIAAAPPEQRDALRKTFLSKYDSDLDEGIELCVSQCRSANNSDDIDCLIAAKTADRASACLK